VSKPAALWRLGLPRSSRGAVSLVRMLVFLALAGFLAFVLYKQITPAFLANPGLNGFCPAATALT
jgi:hypothetical protein